MGERLLTIAAILGWYLTIRYIVLRYGVPALDGDRHKKLETFDHIWASFIAIPLTILSLLLPGIMIAFVIYGVPR